VGAGNVVSANAQRGIELYESSNNVIQGNFIGTNAAGTAALGNGTYGILLVRAASNQIGGSLAGSRNIISGNADRGIYVSGSGGVMAPENLIQGNYIGTDVTGTVGIGNTIGVEIYYGATATVGGAAPGAGNVISANRSGGVHLSWFGVATSGIVVQGNRIGTNAAGTAPLGNTGEGILGAITGNAQILGNLIGGNANNGISLTYGSFVVKGNWIGTDITGTLDLRNTWSGIAVSSAAPCLIGGTGSGEGNVIAFNSRSQTGTTYAGVSITAAAAGQSVRGNRIYSSTGLGIDLHWGGVTPTDACDADTGPNGIQNFPVLTTAIQSGSSTHVTGTLNSKAGTAFSLDFYASPSCDALGYGEGATYLGSTSLSTDGGCNGSFDIVIPVPTSGVVTATATDPAGNTSEFSACAVVASSPVAEVEGVGWASKTELTWSAAAGATSYRVLRGDPASLPDLLDVDIDSCTRFTGAELTSGPALTEDPAVAGLKYYWYLVVGTNGTDDGPFGVATAGVRIANVSGSCP
jgi:parallel beta-helix repeat protein